MTLIARLVLRFRMQPRQRLLLMATRASGHARNSVGAMRSVAGLTTSAQLAMCALLLGTVAIRTSLLCRQTDVGLVAVAADLMAFRRALLLGAVTAAAGDGLLSGMRLMAADAASVARFHQTRLALMAVVATHFVRLRLVRQSLMATNASLVPVIERDLLHARLVAPLAGRDVTQRELEAVRLVAARARGGAVRPVIGGSELMTGRASVNLDAFRSARLSRMRIVAADAIACPLRMIRVNVLVTRRARGGRGRKHVVRRVAVGATVVRRDPSGADYVDLRVAVAAWRGFLLLECVRLVTTSASRVSTGK